MSFPEILKVIGLILALLMSTYTTVKDWREGLPESPPRATSPAP